MSGKNPQPPELPELITLTEALRRTRQSPGRIIRQCVEVWIDFTPVDEGYRWLGRRLMAHRRDPLVPMNGIYKLTEDGQQAIANRTMNYLKWKRFALIKDLTVETETGILIVSSLSKGACPPIPTPKILVPVAVLAELLGNDIKFSEMGPDQGLDQGDPIESLDPLDKLLLKMMRRGVNSGPEIYRQLKRDMVNKNREYDVENILCQWTNDKMREFIWLNGRREQRSSWKTVENRISNLRNQFPDFTKI